MAITNRAMARLKEALTEEEQRAFIAERAYELYWASMDDDYQRKVKAYDEIIKNLDHLVVVLDSTADLLRGERR